MLTRRKFLANSAFSSLAVALGGGLSPACGQVKSKTGLPDASYPLVISTWIHGLPSNEAAWKILQEGGKGVDAVEQGVRVPEGDPENTSVGYGGLPDRDGNVTLDACIMDSDGNAGSVCYLQHIKHPISVARKVMDETPHVILAGEGALQFALSKGFKKENLLTEKTRKHWQKWLVKEEYAPVINVENHDTIGMLAIDSHGKLAGACTTSGLAYKMQGRVGDSPIIGAGMFVDNEVGGAVATGLGEAVLKSLGSFLIVELMRQGSSPQEACEEAIARIVKKQNYKEFQIGYLAVNKAGETGAHSIHPGFNYALFVKNENKLYDASSFVG